MAATSSQYNHHRTIIKNHTSMIITDWQKLFKNQWTVSKGYGTTMEDPVGQTMKIPWVEQQFYFHKTSTVDQDSDDIHTSLQLAEGHFRTVCHYSCRWTCNEANILTIGTVPQKNGIAPCHLKITVFHEYSLQDQDAQFSIFPLLTSVVLSYRCAAVLRVS